MKTALVGAAAKTLPLLLALAGVACTSSEDAPVVASGFSTAQAANAPSSLYPPIQASAVDGYVHEYH